MSTKKVGSTFSKGVDLYSFSPDGYRIEGEKIIYHRFKDDEHHYYPYGDDYYYNKDHYEMAGYVDANPSSYNDRLRVHAQIWKGDKYQECHERSIQVSGNNGWIDKVDIDNMSAPAYITDELCFCFGLYYSDAGIVSGLTNSHQVYGVVTENQSKWMERLFKDIGNDKYAKIKVSDLIFPGSHDSGMYIHRGPFQIASGANTQKDPIQNQLQLGARIFDFRPGKLTSGWAERAYENDLSWWVKALLDAAGIMGAAALEELYSDMKGEILHVHNIIPGATYKSFLKEIITFLKNNEKEIVIINAVSNGIDDAIKHATKQDLDALTTEMLKQYPSLKIGDKESLKKNVKDIIEANERLIIIGNDKILGPGQGVTSKSSYSDSVYQSDDSNNVIKAINELNNKSWKGKDIVEFFFQMTAQATHGGMARIATSNYQAASPLFATKAATDQLTYTWLLEGNLKYDNEGALITLYNDYYDCGLTAVIARVLRERIAGTFIPIGQGDKVVAVDTENLYVHIGENICRIKKDGSKEGEIKFKGSWGVLDSEDIYFTRDEALFRKSKTGNSPATQLDNHSQGYIAVDANNVYFQSSNQLYKKPKNSNVSEGATLFDVHSYGPIYVDANNVFFQATGHSLYKKHPWYSDKEGPATEFDVNCYSDIALDKDYVYFAGDRSRLYRKPKTDTTEESGILIYDYSINGRILVDDNYVYFRADKKLWRKSKDGAGSAKQIFPFDIKWWFIQDKDFIYVTSPNGQIWRIKKSEIS